MKIITIIGARPQFIKTSMVSRAIGDYNKNPKISRHFISEKILHTGQHYDYQMNAVFFEQMRIPEPEYTLDINGLPHGAMIGRMLEKIEEILKNEVPDMVMVYGDTNSTLAGALAAAKMHIPVAHVEAGLRSFNLKMPEEINRKLTDHISNLHFCPTKQAVSNLNKENIKEDVFLVGDVMLDAALYYTKYAIKPTHDIPETFLLATLHREENTDDHKRLQSIFNAMNKLSHNIPIILPLHPRTLNRLKEIKQIEPGPGIQVIEPLGYLEMIYLLKRSALVMTDSGGLQKEAYFFQKPCVTLRKETEWLELVKNDYNSLAGFETENILNAYSNMKNKKVDSRLNLYGDGQASKRIVEQLLAF